MLDAETARERAEAMDRRHKTLGDRWDATAIEYLRVQAETLEDARNNSKNSEQAEFIRLQLNQALKKARAEIARMEAHDAG